MENESETPAAALSGPELCERVAQALGWKRNGEYEVGSIWVTHDDRVRVVPSDPDLWDTRAGFFRPDIPSGGNQLAEVKAGCDRRGWCYSSGRDPRPFGNVWEWDPIECRYEFEIGKYAETESVAFLRAFVAAADASQP